MNGQAWKTRPFQFTLVGTIVFVVLTAIAMVIYPGGSIADPETGGYSFFRNFFSELGLTVTRGGHTNTVCAILFFLALSMAGAGLVLFFVAVPQYFKASFLLKALSIAGSIFGVISGLSFMGVAFTPADLLPGAHGEFVMAAFRSFLVVAAFYALAVALNPIYPNRYALVYLGFAILLAAYIWLMINGPAPDTPDGVMVQATGQKIISYAAIICMAIQSWGVLKIAEAKGADGAEPAQEVAAGEAEEAD